MEIPEDVNDYDDTYSMPEDESFRQNQNITPKLDELPASPQSKTPTIDQISIEHGQREIVPDLVAVVTSGTNKKSKKKQHIND